MSCLMLQELYRCWFYHFAVSGLVHSFELGNNSIWVGDYSCDLYFDVFLYVSVFFPSFVRGFPSSVVWSKIGTSCAIAPCAKLKFSIF
jgi:hypothetical protein